MVVFLIKEIPSMIYIHLCTIYGDLGGFSNDIQRNKGYIYILIIILRQQLNYSFAVLWWTIFTWTTGWEKSQRSIFYFYLFCDISFTCVSHDKWMRWYRTFMGKCYHSMIYKYIEGMRAFNVEDRERIIKGTKVTAVIKRM